jgi:hypothetical protein
MRGMRTHLAEQDLYAWAEACLEDAGVLEDREPKALKT